MVFPKENPLSSFLKEQCENGQMLVNGEASDSITEEEESEASPEESEDSWEIEDSYPPVKIMGMGDGVSSDDARSEMADPPPPVAAAAPSRGNLVFTRDDIPYSRWPDKLQEFSPYLTTRALTSESNHELMSDFVSRFIGTLRNRWTGLTEQDQLQFLIKSLVEAIHILHVYFVGHLEDLRELKMKDFFERKCYSYKRKHQDLHFKHMVRLFYELGADISLKISLEKDDVKSLFSLNEEAGPSSIAALEVLTDFDSKFSEYESDNCYMTAEDTDLEGINLVNSVSHVSVLVYISKYARLIKVIAFLDTRAIQTIVNSKVPPKKCWKPHTKNFSTAYSEVFSTYLISRSIKIQFFPGCFLITRVLGSALHRKDIVVDWDVITKINGMMPKEVRFKHYFQPYVQIPRLFMAQEDEVKQILSGLVQELKQQSCADSYKEFLKKCPHPLWKK
ncbi:hypothetical protein CRG98_030836 [Punica granatum]|uniref:Uncharacterized protein n=1 Tax=Punica granatum TaxID=22663 RepID=A0A2I0IXT1_PUNGR|nr:hypothetical protein CRG98_030836 [Punica granatum]